MQGYLIHRATVLSPSFSNSSGADKVLPWNEVADENASDMGSIGKHPVGCVRIFRFVPFGRTGSL